MTLSFKIKHLVESDYTSNGFIREIFLSYLVRWNIGCIGFLSPMHKKIPDSYSKREGGNPGNSGLSSQK